MCVCPRNRRLKFDDLHQAGIYTWPYLYDLGLHKLSYSRQYIRALRARGLSREPARGGVGQARGTKGRPAGAAGQVGQMGQHDHQHVHGPGCGHEH